MDSQMKLEAEAFLASLDLKTLLDKEAFMREAQEEYGIDLSENHGLVMAELNRRYEAERQLCQEW